jgi:hypothetical protein
MDTTRESLGHRRIRASIGGVAILGVVFVGLGLGVAATVRAVSNCILCDQSL